MDFKRQMDDGECQFEYQDNCQVVTLAKSQVLKKIHEGELSIVVSEGVNGAEQVNPTDTPLQNSAIRTTRSAGRS